MNTPLAQGQTDAPPQTAMEIAGPVAPHTQSVVRREPIPRELAALGVVIAVDPESEMQMLIIPKQLRETANVLAPIQAFQQADANWRPSLRVVELDPAPDGPHFYKQQGNKLAPRKQALELLADAAGVVQIRTSLLGRERVEVGAVVAETFTHVAVLKIRKSDGTLRTLEASRTYEPFAEYEEIRTSVGSGQYAKTPGTAEYDAEVRKRWLNEIKFAKAKNESKAINRAMRAALQIPQTFTVADAAKSFVVIGWNLAPQSTEAVQAAIAQLYGAAPEALELTAPSSHDWDAPQELPGGEVVHEDGEAVPSDAAEPSQQATAVAPVPPVEAAVAPGATDASVSLPADAAASERVAEAGVQEPVVVGDPPAPIVWDSPAADGNHVEPEREPVDEAGDQEPVAVAHPAPAPTSSEEPVIPGVAQTITDNSLTTEEEAALTTHLAVKIPAGSYQSRSLGWVLELGDAADEWLSYALRQPWPEDQSFKVALTVAVKAFRPEMFAAWRAEA